MVTPWRSRYSYIPPTHPQSLIIQPRDRDILSSQSTLQLDILTDNLSRSEQSSLESKLLRKWRKCVIRLDFHTSFDFLGYGVETYVNVRIVNTGIGVMCTRARDSDYTENYLSYKVGVQQEIGYGVSMGGDMGWTVTRVSETPYSHRTTDTTYQQYLRRLGMEDHTSTYIHCEYRHSDNLCSHLMIKEADGQQNSLDVCWNADSRDKHRTVYTDILRVGGQWNYTLARDLGV
ncbi:hypothetical protein Tco_0563530 [Tanacetum coccineum]